MAFRNLLNRPRSALRFQWDSFEQLSFVIYKCQKDRGFPEAEGVVGIKSICNCCSGLGAEALATSLPLFLLWIYTVPLEWHRFAHPSSSWIFQCSIKNKNCRGICLGVLFFFPSQLCFYRELSGLGWSLQKYHCKKLLPVMLSVQHNL